MKILILCTGNSCRSQMAHGFLRSFDDRLEVASAGSRPAAAVNPNAVRVMGEEGIDIGAAKPRDVRDYLGERWDYVITVCGNADRDCPAFIGDVGERLHIGFPDPADAEGTEEEVLAVFRESRDAIRTGFHDFYQNKVRPQLED